MRTATRLAVAASACAAAFGVLCVAHVEGGLVPLDTWGKRAFTEPFGHWTTTPGPSHTYRAEVVNATGNAGGAAERWASWPVFGWASELGEGATAAGMTVATAALLVLLGRWRSTILATAVSVAVGLAVDPLQDALFACQGCHFTSPSPGRPESLHVIFPSGHTIGATVAFGLFLLLGARAVVAATPPRPHDWRPRLAAWLWALVALAVGFDRMAVWAHAFGDVLAGWAFGAAAVLGTLALDAWWHRGPRAAPSSEPTQTPKREGTP